MLNNGLIKFFCLIFVLALTACGGSNDNTGQSNEKPVAVVTANDNANSLEQVDLDASSSTDAETATASLSFSWSFSSVPTGSRVTTLINPNAIQAYFIPDIPGQYDVRLVVNDGSQDSDPDIVTITVSEATASLQIATALSQTVTPINRAVVSYIIPAIGNDVAGFTLQADPLGPAIFVAVDASTTTPALQVGDIVSLDAQAFQVAAQIVQVTDIANLVVHNSGFDATVFSQTVGNTLDLVSNLNEYGMELVSADNVLVTAPPVFAGQDFQTVLIDTAVISGNNLLRLRMPATLLQSLGLEVDCQLNVSHTPLWRFNDVAQISAWSIDEISNIQCPESVLVTAFATSSNSVTIRFNRGINPGSVLADGSQFSSDNGLSVTAASVQGPDLLLQTQTQTGGTTYNLTIDTSVEDVLGRALNANNSTTSVLGFIAPPNQGGVVISEMMINPTAVNDNLGEWIEIYNPGPDVNLRGCIISDDGSDSHAIETDLLIPVGGFVTLARSDQPGFIPDYIYSNFLLGNSSDQIIISCNGTEVDRVDYLGSITAGVSRQLSASAMDAVSNDGDNWCDSTTNYNNDLGTPGDQNLDCPQGPVISYCILAFPTSTSIAIGTSLTGYAHVRIPGITDTSNLGDAYADLIPQIGFGAVGSNPNTWNTWSNGTLDVTGLDHPNLDMYFANTGPISVGNYDVAFRFSNDNGNTWLYCDTNGSDDGYQSNNAGKLTVTVQ